jgi:peptidoglycan/xylan/chitin deacetylase (PgdA/CDA1 family)
VEIGAHTVNHPRLGRIAEEEIAPEVTASRSALQELTGKPVATFSYPHSSTSPYARAQVQRAGFSLACAGIPELVGAHSDPFLLPRIWPSNVPGDRFAWWLRRVMPVR